MSFTLSTAEIDTIRSILDKHNLSLEELKFLLSKQTVPVSIFKTGIGPLAALCIYLKDYEKLSLSEIANKLNRDQRTIWATYNKAKQKVRNLELDSLRVPLSIFQNRRKSIMENLVYHLRSELNMTLKDIAKLLGRNNKTIWCFYSRALKKNEN